jgi:hypothetical protein
MPEPTAETRRSALAVVEAFEAAAFRTAHVARHLLADNPDLPVWQLRPSVSGYQNPDVLVVARLEISTWAVDGVGVWATALGTTVNRTFFDSRGGSQAFEHHETVKEVGGVEVTIHASRRDLSPAELAAWRTQQDPTAEGGER